MTSRVRFVLRRHGCCRAQPAAQRARTDGAWARGHGAWDLRHLAGRHGLPATDSSKYGAFLEDRCVTAPSKCNGDRLCVHVSVQWRLLPDGQGYIQWGHVKMRWAKPSRTGMAVVWNRRMRSKKGEGKGINPAGHHAKQWCSVARNKKCGTRLSKWGWQGCRGVVGRSG